MTGQHLTAGGLSRRQGQDIEDYGNLNQYLVNGDPTSAPYYNNRYNGIDSSLGIGPNPLLITESRAAMNHQAGAIHSIAPVFLVACLTG